MGNFSEIEPVIIILFSRCYAYLYFTLLLKKSTNNEEDEK